MAPSEAEGLFVHGNAGKTPRLRSGPSVLGNVRYRTVRLTYFPTRFLRAA
jgi:hypothetical protein